MVTRKSMKSFNVKKYNDEINKLNKMIETVNNLILTFRAWEGEDNILSREWFESLLTLPFAKIRHKLSPIYMAGITHYSYGVDFDSDETDLPTYIDYLDKVNCDMKRQMEFLKLLPEIQKAYGSLLIWNYNKEECEMSKYAERLIMEQCIEWEEDYMDEEV